MNIEWLNKKLICTIKEFERKCYSSTEIENSAKTQRTSLNNSENFSNNTHPDLKT